MKFPQPEAVLVHAVEPVLPDGGFSPTTSAGPVADIQNQRKKDGEDCAKTAKDKQNMLNSFLRPNDYGERSVND